MTLTLNKLPDFVRMIQRPY